MKYGRLGLTLLAAAALVAGILPPQALADSNARIVRLSYVDGDTKIDHGDGRGFEHAYLNMPLGPGTRVTTGSDGRAEIEFEDMSTVRLTPETLVETQSLDLRSSGAKYSLVDLEDGAAYFDVRKRNDENDFRVTTGRREFSPTRASRFRLRVERSQVVLAVFSGEVEVIGEGSSLTVRKNETLTLDVEDPARYFLAKGVSSGPYDDWDREREDYRQRYAQVGNYNGYSSDYSYGVSDLNYWGSYTYIAGYGYMWRPYYYGVNWNPYANGAWYWYPGYGWVWVSAYPWGWMPFRYGSWYYISGQGWCWRPGNHWHHWSPVVAVHNPPPGHHAPTPPPPTGGRDPVIVGQGPATILPAAEPGLRRRGVQDPNLLYKKSGSPAAASGSGGAAGSPASNPGGTPPAGSGGSAGSSAGGSVGSGGGGQPAAGSGGRPSDREREIELKQAIRDAHERRLVGSHVEGVITNSVPGSSASSEGNPGSGDSGAAAQDASPASGRGRVPEPRRQLPPAITRDEPASGSSAGSSGSANSGWNGGGSNTSGSATPSPAAASAPSSGGGRVVEPRPDVPRESYMQSSGSASSRSSSNASSQSSPPSSSSSSGGHSAAGSAGGSSYGSRSSGGSSSAGRSSSSGHSSSSSSSGSSTNSNPK